jgi:hypothetical protein
LIRLVSCWNSAGDLFFLRNMESSTGIAMEMYVISDFQKNCEAGNGGSSADPAVLHLLYMCLPRLVLRFGSYDVIAMSGRLG